MESLTNESIQIYSWCRRSSRGKSDVLSLCELEPLAFELGLDRLLKSRTFDTYTISYSRLIETITWGYIEREIFAVSFPGMDSACLDHICTLQGWITAGGT